MKRFTETNKWRDTWFQELPLKYKLFWLYILDECDVAGVWKPNIKLAQFQIGEQFEESELKRVFKDRISVIENDYWFITKFIEFQYGKLSPNSNLHIGVIKSLERHKIENPVFIEFEGYPGRVQDKDKDKVKVKEQDKVKDKDGKKEIQHFGEYTPEMKFVTVQPRLVGSNPCRINGVLGLTEYFQSQMSQVNHPEWAPKFMTEFNGKAYNDFSHLWNAYNAFVDKQYK